MFAIPGILGLLLFIYVRPQEIVPALARVPFLYLFLALSLFGLMIDLRLRVTKPQTNWLIIHEITLGAK